MRCFFVLMGLIALSLVLAACPHASSSSDDEQKPPLEETTKARFINSDIFRVSVYSDSGRISKLADIEPLKEKTVETFPNAVGTPFYLIYYISIEGAEIPYYDTRSNVVARINEKKTNVVTIPALTSIETSTIYVKIQNSSNGALTFRQGSNELIPDDAQSTILNSGETGVYQIQAGSASNYSFMKNTSIPLSFPAGMTEFQSGHVYSFRYNGTSIVLVNDAVIDISNASFSAESFSQTVSLLNAHAVNGRTYTVELKKDESIDPLTLSCGGRNVTIILKGDEAERKVGLTARKTGSLFTIGTRVTLILDNNITLQGINNNTAGLVRVNSAGALIMKDGSKITGNKSNSSSSGGGVYVDSSGTFTMSGGTISGNGSYYSFYGGVYVNSSGTFTISGGTISGNASFSSGSGVYVNGGTFTMSDGTISGNTTSSSSDYSDYSYGGGVYVASGTFTMSGGTISGNTSHSFLYFSYGGGVYIGSGTFTMSGGIISGNTSHSSLHYSYGGGVYIDSGTFTMSGGIISGNSSKSNSSYFNSYGGGVYVNGGTFTKGLDGVIYGSNASDTLQNKASIGKAVYVGSRDSKRNTTAGEGVTMDSRLTGSNGGWE
ncbi:autotransporter outer membrane beta-barrel domain-containing protein [Breznakiellaceae bacterium SP9]